MFEGIDEIRRTRKKYNAQMFLSGVDAFREYEELEAKALAAGALAPKSKELIALGISISQACYGCIEYHVGRAVELGASRQEVLEAAAVALVLGGGLAQWPARFVFKVLEELEHQEHRGEPCR